MVRIRPLSSPLAVYESEFSRQTEQIGCTYRQRKREDRDGGWCEIEMFKEVPYVIAGWKIGDRGKS